MSIHLESKALINAQQMEVAVHGPDGATHLILCTGVIELTSVGHETYTFLVGPQLSRRQFVGAIASGALSTIEAQDKNPNTTHTNADLRVSLIIIDAAYDEQANQVKVQAEILSGMAITRLAIHYQVNILAELPTY